MMQVEERQSDGITSAGLGLDPPPDLLGSSLALSAVRTRLSSIARAQRTTLILGPTGSGKEVVARSLHERSERRRGPFVPVHCGALPDTLLEAELFGHSRGAFTGATHERHGLIRTAARGTLFLDEIDSLPLPAQSKLLRFLESGEYRPVGSDRTERSDSWVIAASNQDLYAHAREGRMRIDLLYRLDVVKVELPPLQERGYDVLELADHFLSAAGQGARRLSERARAALRAHPWPGNVRELRHRVEAAALLTDSPVIDAEDLGLSMPPAHGGCSEYASADLASSEERLDSTGVRRTVLPGPAESEGSQLERVLWELVSDRGLSLGQATALCEQMLVRAALRAERNNRTRAADRLGINVRTIYKKMGR